MIVAFAIVLLGATAVVWLGVALPRLAQGWVALARDLDPASAASHVLLFDASPDSVSRGRHRRVPGHP